MLLLSAPSKHVGQAGNVSAQQNQKVHVERTVQVSRGLLPDVGSEYEGAGGDITDAVDFLLVNFTEMNKLWVRMQHQGSNRDKYVTPLSSCRTIIRLTGMAVCICRCQLLEVFYLQCQSYRCLQASGV